MLIYVLRLENQQQIKLLSTTGLIFIFQGNIIVKKSSTYGQQMSHEHNVHKQIKAYNYHSVQRLYIATYFVRKLTIEIGRCGMSINEATLDHVSMSKKLKIIYCCS